MKQGDAIKQLEQAIIERSIHSKNLIRIDNYQIINAGKDYSFKKCVSGNGEFELLESSIIGRFHGETGSYQLRIRMPEQLQANGLTVRFRLSGWSDVRYLAVGHSAGNEFRHVKIANPSLGEWVTFSIGYNDLAYGLKNDWQSPGVGTVPDIRLYLSGAPEPSGAEMEVQWAATWLEQPANCKSLMHEDYVASEALSEAIFRYFKRCNPFIESQTMHFFSTGDLPLNGEKSLFWAADEIKPSSLNESGTYRYLWHALQPAISLMVHYRDTKSVASLCAARDFMSSWLEQSFFKTDLDVKYTWYDHGTSERLLAFLYMYKIGSDEDFDQRFMARLRFAIFAHSQLLESEVFYAAHQPSRFHNHAWFQDIALIASACAFPRQKAASRWFARGIQRLTDQLNHLIVRDEGYAIFVENSIGYHHGVMRLVEFAGELVTLFSENSEIPQIADELNAWSDFLRYPDGRSPSQGDTFRQPNPPLLGMANQKWNPYKKAEYAVLSKAGYAVAKGNHYGAPFMLCMFASSLNKTHKHEDNLSFTFFFDGVEWFIDPSFYSHDHNAEVPSYLRSARAHNAIFIDEPYSIEPGVARLEGQLIGSSLVLSGEHTAYENYKVTRDMNVNLELVEVQITDKVIPCSGKKNEEIYSVLHLGEAVVPEEVEGGFVLRHTESRNKLKILVNSDSYKIVHGLGRGSKHLSVSGEGFMKYSDTYSILISYENHRCISYSFSIES